MLNFSVKNLLTPRSVIDIDSYLAKYFRFRFIFTQFIDRNQKLGLSAFFNADNTLLPYMELRDETGQFINRSFSAGLNLNKRTGLNHLMSLSGNYENLNLIPDFISASQLKSVSYNYMTFTYMNQFNSLDNKHFPNKGLLFNISINTSKLLTGKIRTDSYKETFSPDNPGDFLFKRSYSFSGNLRHYFSPDNNRFTFNWGADLLFIYTTDSIISQHNYYFAGGIESVFSKSVTLTGFHPCEIPVEQFGGLKFDVDFEFHQDLHLTLMTNVALAREPGNNNDVSMLGGYGIGIGYMSIVGPIKIGIMHGLSSGDRYFSSIKGYINLGFSF